jgi:DUF4097 and DUF4098 domain-containing protein YvlB
MNRDQTSARRLATLSGAILGLLCALLMLSAQSNAGELGKYTEEFHHTYPLASNGRISLSNVNGGVHITAWDREEVQLDAVKSSNRKDELAKAEIEVNAGSGYVEIRTQYYHHDLTFNSDRDDNPASVEYTLKVPRGARLDEISLVNGPLNIDGVSGAVQASCVNGHVKIRNLQGLVELSSVNGRLDAEFDRVSKSSITLSAVNGELSVTLPSDVKARLEASTVSGSIDDDFGIPVQHQRYVGQNLTAELGGGGANVELSNVNGQIEIHHARDGRGLSSVRDLERDDDQGDDGDDI